MLRLRLGFVGCGRISQKHFDALTKLSDKFEVVATCDIDLAKAKNAATLYNVKAYGSIDQMLNNEKLDIVTLATPNGLHASHAILCAEKGIDVICEKPMATTWQDGIRIKESFERLNRKFFLIHQNRYNETVTLLKNAIDQGFLGKIYFITSNVLWQRPQEYYDKEPWHGTKFLDGGAFMTQASHYVDLVNWLLNEEVTEVYSSLGTLARNIETEDVGSAVIKWRSGVIGNINVTVLTYPRNLEGSVTVIAEKGTVKIGGPALNEILHWEVAEHNLDAKTVNNTNYSTSSVYGFGHHKLYEKVFEHYHDNSKDIIDLESALQSLKILCAILESNEKKQPVIFK